MADEETGWMPETIGSPPTILYWEINEVVPVFILFAFGIFIGQMKLCLLGIVIYFYAFSKVRERLPKGFTINLLYRAGLLQLKNYPVSIARQFKE